MKFKVGDKVRITGPKSLHSVVAWVSEMDKYVGEIRTIKNYNPYFRYYKVQGVTYNFDETWLEPICDQKILITTDGKETKARLYDGKKVVKEAVAKCSPRDDFDFETGAEIAFNRLTGKEERPKSKLYNGKVICVQARTPLFTKGKIYSVNNGTLINNYGGKEKSDCADLEDLNNRQWSQFIEIVED